MNGGPRRQRGQVLLLLTLTFVPIVLMIAYLFNTGELLARKQKLQNAADAAALAQANYMARSLNVMAMNNVAISQTLAVDVLFASLAPALASLISQELAVGGPIISAAAACAGPQALVPPCPYLLARFIAFGIASAYFDSLAAIGGDVILKLQFPGGHIWAYAALSDNLANQFPDVSRVLQSDLSTNNGVLADTRLVLLGSTVGTQANDLGTELPVTHVDWEHPDLFNLNSDWDEGKNRQLLYNAGLSGTRPDFSKKLQAWNYQFHGYPFNTGPYAADRDNLYDYYNGVLKALAVAIPEWTPGVVESKDKADQCWKNATTQAPPNEPSVVIVFVLPWGCESTSSTIGLPLLPGIYGFRPQQAPDQWPGVIDLIALTHAQRAGGPIAPQYFNAVPGEMFGIARARVYNATAADLYSSDWRATLTPVFPTRIDSPHVDDCCGPYYIQDGGQGGGSDGAVDELVQLFPVLSGSTTWLSKDDWRAMLTR